MAERIELRDVTIPAGTTQATPLSVDVSFDPGVVTAVEIVIPDGVAGLSGIQLAQAHQHVIPYAGSAFLVSNDETVKWPLDGYLNTGNWQVIGYNTDVFDHTYHLRFLIDELGGVDTTPPSSPLAISPGASEAPSGGAGATEPGDTGTLAESPGESGGGEPPEQGPPDIPEQPNPPDEPLDEPPDEPDVPDVPDTPLPDVPPEDDTGDTPDTGDSTLDLGDTPGSARRAAGTKRHPTPRPHRKAPAHSARPRKPAPPAEGVPAGTADRISGHPELHPGVSQVANAIRHKWPVLRIGSTTGGTHAANSLHYRGEAVDLFVPYSNPQAQRDMDRAAAWIAQHMTHALSEGIHNPGLSVKDGRTVPPSFWGATVWEQHRNHIHIGRTGGPVVTTTAPTASPRPKRTPHPGRHPVHPSRSPTHPHRGPSPVKSPSKRPSRKGTTPVPPRAGGHAVPVPHSPPGRHPAPHASPGGAARTPAHRAAPPPAPPPLRSPAPPPHRRHR